MASETERQAITSHLLDLADEYRCRILDARDYGSRARALDDPSSDYDVMFVFAEPPAEYVLGDETLTLERTLDEGESRLNTEIELAGWNLKRFVGNDGLHGSNPTALEFAASGEQYYRDPDPHIAEMCNHALQHFKPYALINHYRSMAASNYGKYIEQSWVREWSQHDIEEEFPQLPGSQTQVDENAGVLRIGILGYDEHTLELPLDEAKARGIVRETTRDPSVKRYLNVAQALCRARLIEDEREMPHLDVNELLRETAHRKWMPQQVYARIGDLIGKKVDGNGAKEQTCPAIEDWIERELERDVNPEDEYVMRDPDPASIYGTARQCYNEIDWTGI